MLTGITHGIAIHDDLLEVIQSVAHWSKFFREPQGNYQMYREKLTQRLYRQLRNDGMTKPEAVAAIKLGTGDKPLPVHHSADPTWATYSNKQSAMESMPHYHQLKRRRF